MPPYAGLSACLIKLELYANMAVIVRLTCGARAKRSDFGSKWMTKLSELLRGAVPRRMKRRSGPFENYRQIFQRFVFPRCHVGDDIPHGPRTGHAGFH